MTGILFRRIGVLALISLLWAATPARAEVPTDRATSLDPGRQIQGELTRGDWLREDDTYADAFRVEVAAGQTYQVTMTSDNFDTYLLIFDATGQIVLASNDDGQDLGTHSQTIFEGPQSGVVYIAANSLRAEVFGGYTLQVQALDAASGGGAQLAQEGSIQPLPLDQPTAGLLSDRDQTLDDDSYADFYTVRLQAGTEYVITMRSDAVDAYLQLFSPDIEQLARNDDGPGLGLNSQIPFTPNETGSYLIVASSLGSGETGAYEIIIHQGEAVATDLLRDDAPVQNAVRAAPLPNGATMHAIVLGLDYSHQSGGHLPQCDDDAVFIADTLRSRIPADQLNLQLLVNSEATISSLEQHLADIVRRIRPQDTLFLFYSGHGGQTQSNNQFVNEADRKREFICLYDGNFSDTMLEQSLDGLNQDNHALTILAMDSCFSGGFQQIVDRPGRMAMLSSQEYLVSGVPRERDEYNRLFGGHLTKLFCLALQGHADGAAAEVAGPPDGRVTVLELEKYIRNQWRSIAIDGQYQEPQFHRSEVAPDMVVITTSATTASHQQFTDSNINQNYQQRSIEPGGSYYTADFAAIAGHSYFIETTELTNGLDTILQVRGSTNDASAMPDDPVLAENDDFEGFVSSRIEWTCPTSGSYYVAVDGFEQTAGQFNLTLREVADGNIQNNNGTDDTRLAISFDNFFISPDDPVHSTDIQLQAGQIYRFQTHGLSEGCDTRIQLRLSTNPETALDSDPVVAEDDDGAEEALASRLIWICDQSGSYYITSRSFGETSGSFSLDMEQLTVADELVNRQQSIEPGTIYYSADFRATEGQTYLFETSDLVGGLDTILQVRGSTNTETALPDDPLLAEDDDGAMEDLASQLLWTCPANGNYYIAVNGYEQTAGQFTLTQREIAGGNASNNRITDTSRLALSFDESTVSSNTPFHSVDFQLQAGQTYRIRTHSLSEGCDTLIELRRSTDPAASHESDPIVAEDDDGADEELASQLTWVCDQSGPFYITTRSYGDTSGSFSMTVDQIMPVVDQVSRQLSIEAGGSYYSADFAAVAGHTYFVETSDLTGELDTILQVRLSTSTESALPDDPVLAENDDIEGAVASRLEWICTASGNYYISVRGYEQTAGQFTLTFREIAGGDSPGNSQADGSRLAIAYEDVNIAPDDPVYSNDFQLQAGQTYRVWTHHLSEGCDTLVQLRESTDPDAAHEDDPIVLENDDRDGNELASELTWTCDRTGAYYVTALSYGETTGTFSMNIEQVSGN